MFCVVLYRILSARLPVCLSFFCDKYIYMADPEGGQLMAEPDLDSDFDDEDEDFHDVRQRYVVRGSSLNSGKAGVFYNELNPSHTRSVFLAMCGLCMVLVVILFLIIFEWDSIVHFMKMKNLVPQHHHRNIFRNQVAGRAAIHPRIRL